MMKSNADFANEVIKKLLELLASAQIGKRGALKDSCESHNLTGAIAAYGKALGFLLALQKQEELYGMVGELELLESLSGQVH